MSAARAINVGGNQGRGNPGQACHLVRAPAPDALALALADHIRQVTPGLREDLSHPAWYSVARWRVRRLTRLAQMRLDLIARTW